MNLRTWARIGHLSVVVLLLLANGCEDKVRVSDDDIQVLREPELLEAMNRPGVVLVDVRKPEVYAAGHIPGAINIFLPHIRRNDPRLSAAKQIIVYGAGWTDSLSRAAAKSLMSQGYANVHEFQGGIEVWTSTGRDLVQTLPASEGRPERGG